jgi:hypothetical protein
MSADVVPDNCEGFADMTIKALSDIQKRTNQYLIGRAASGRVVVECRQLSVTDRFRGHSVPVADVLLARHDENTSQQRIGECIGFVCSGDQSGHRCWYSPFTTHPQEALRL